MLSLGIVSFNQVSVNAIIVAVVESIIEESATFFEITLLMLVYKKQLPFSVLDLSVVNAFCSLGPDEMCASCQTGEATEETSFAQFA